MAATNGTELSKLNRGFRETYLDYAELTSQLRDWERAFPDRVRLRSLGKSSEGREIWVLQIGNAPDERRPAVWVDGNMHATELCGSSVALAIAEDVLALHAGGAGQTPAGAVAASLPAAIVDTLRDVHFFVVPRMSPDGAEHVLKSGRYVRSSPEDARQHKGHAHWRLRDMDGDGVVRMLRKRDPAGEVVEADAKSGMLVPRRIEHTGPFYKVFPEGEIANFDGVNIPDPHFLGDNAVDFNRNFPWSWAPEGEQAGAGDFPGSAPETRAVMQFVTERPNLFAWLNLHTFGGVFIRPLGHSADDKMDQGDLAIFRQIEAWNKELTGYPTVSGYHEFLYEPEKPLRGDLSDYAYHQRGCIAYVCELWDLFKRIGMETKKPFVNNYTHMDEKDLLALAQWDAGENKGRIFQKWRPLTHPQLGEVEVGGVDTRVGLSNPPYELIDTLCRAHSAAFLRVAALVPRVDVALVRTEALGGDLTKVSLRVRNTGYLGTYGLPSAKALAISEPLRLTVAGEGVSVAAPAEAVVEVGHLDGWGQGLYASSLFLPWTRGSVSEKVVTLVVKGKGALRVSVDSCRIGSVRTTVEVG
jgi:hypothetical protein